MALVSLVSVLILVQYMFFCLQVGMARGRTGIAAPAMTGDEEFERHLRVQLNTLEQMAVTLPMMWICAHFFRPDVAAAAGAVFIVGRFIFRAAYLSDPSKRAPGMVMGFLANVVMILLTLWGLVAQL